MVWRYPAPNVNAKARIGKLQNRSRYKNGRVFSAQWFTKEQWKTGGTQRLWRNHLDIHSPAHPRPKGLPDTSTKINP
jgi:hypothetical protein